MCWLVNACTFEQAREFVFMVLFVGGFFVGLPLALVLGWILVERDKAKRTGIDLDAILNDVRREIDLRAARERDSDHG